MNINDRKRSGRSWYAGAADAIVTGEAIVKSFTGTAPAAGARTFTLYDGLDTDGTAMVSLIVPAGTSKHLNWKDGLRFSTGITVDQSGLFGSVLTTWVVP